MARDGFFVRINDVQEVGDNGECDAEIPHECGRFDTASDHLRNYPPAELLAHPQACAAAPGLAATRVLWRAARLCSRLPRREALQVTPQGIGRECALRILDLANPDPLPGGVGHQQIDLSRKVQAPPANASSGIRPKGSARDGTTRSCCCPRGVLR